MQLFFVFILFAVLNMEGQSIPAGWKAVKDSHGKCQIGVPADYSLANAAAGFANAKDHGIEVILTSREGNTLKPLSEAGMKVAGVDKVTENTAQKRFYAMKPHTSQGKVVTSWYEIIPYPGGTCSANITIREGAPQDQFRQIAASLSPSK
jgi:hypothetical protein